MASYAQKLVVLRDVEKLKETSLNCLNISSVLRHILSQEFVYEKTRNENLFGEMVILAGHCPLTDLHLEPCVDTNNQKCFFTMRGVVRMSVGR